MRKVTITVCGRGATPDAACKDAQFWADRVGCGGDLAWESADLHKTTDPLQMLLSSDPRRIEWSCDATFVTSVAE